jgi:hypothetical protein
MKIGEAVVLIQRSKAERIRVLDSIKSKDGRPWEVFNTYAEKVSDKEYWKRTHKFLKITGFRPGRANAFVISKILNGVSSGDDKCENAFWRLYRCCVVDCMNEEHSELNSILLERDMEGNANSTEDIFKIITKYISLYSVDSSELRDLYQIWWFDRIEGLDSIVENIDINMDVIKELVSSSEKNLTKKIEKIAIEVQELSRLLNDNSEKNKQNKAKTSEEIKILKELIEEEKIKFENRISNILSGKISDIEDKIKDTAPVETVVENVIDVKLKEVIENNRTSIKKITEELSEIKIENDEKKHSYPGGTGAKDHCIVDVAKMSQRLREYYKMPDECNAASAVLSSLVNSFGAFYVESESLVNVLFKDFVSAGLCKEVVVDPSYVSVEFLKEIDLSGIDLLIFKNISSGFIEGYLIPTLLRGNTSIDKSFPKIVVIMDGEVSESLNSEILKHSLLFTSEFLQTIMCAKFIDSTQSDLASIANEVIIDGDYEELLKILENSGVRIPIEVSERYVKFSEMLKKYIPEGDVIPVSTPTIVYSYMKYKYGTVKSETVTEVLKGIV